MRSLPPAFTFNTLQHWCCQSLAGDFHSGQKPDLDTDVQWRWISPRQFFPWELLLPQAEIETLQCRIEGLEGGGMFEVQKIPSSTEGRGWFFTEILRQQGETTGRTSPEYLIHPSAPCHRKGTLRMRIRWGEGSLSVFLINFLCQLKGPSAADSQSQGRDVSVLVPQHPLVAGVLLSDRDRWPFGRFRVIKEEYELYSQGRKLYQGR